MDHRRVEHGEETGGDRSRWSKARVLLRMRSVGTAGVAATDENMNDTGGGGDLLRVGGRGAGHSPDVSLSETFARVEVLG